MMRLKIEIRTLPRNTGLLTHRARLKYWMRQITGTKTNRGKLNGTHQG